MSMPAERREQVRRRSGFACEYCGVTETDAAGQLTLDHYQPHAHDGSDALENLVYCCHRCNEYKSDYWPQTTNDLPLWNPRQDTADQHFLELDDGSLYATSPTGTFTLRRLRLNRPPLIAHRLRRRQDLEQHRLIDRLQSLADLLERLHAQHQTLLEEQQILSENNSICFNSSLNSKAQRHSVQMLTIFLAASAFVASLTATHFD